MIGWRVRGWSLFPHCGAAVGDDLSCLSSASVLTASLLTSPVAFSDSDTFPNFQAIIRFPLVSFAFLLFVSGFFLSSFSSTLCPFFLSLISNGNFGLELRVYSLPSSHKLHHSEANHPLPPEIAFS